MESEKRELSNSDDEFVGPLPPKQKKIKKLEYEHIYLENLPCAEAYEKSYMHRDVLVKVIVTKTDFLITASIDGHIKFWKINEDGIEFVKHFRAHIGNVQDMASNYAGTLVCSISNDKTLKVFDVVNFDMINMMKLSYIPGHCEWIHRSGDAISALGISEIGTKNIYIYDGRGSKEPLHTLDVLHTAPVVLMKYNPIYDTVISVDKNGILEYWSGMKNDFKFPKQVSFQSKLDTDLFEFAKCKVYPTGLAFSPKGDIFATIATDRKIRVFKFLTGKLTKIFDEGLKHLTELQQSSQQLPNMEFGRRMALERDLEKSEWFQYTNIVFDESGYFILYGTLLGVKIVNLFSNKCIKMLGKGENIRPLNLALYQGIPNRPKGSVSIEMKASENPNLDNIGANPTLFCTAFKKNRFYIYSRHEPDDTKSSESERDIFNEKPSKEDALAATESSGQPRVSSNCIIHTTMGDIHCKLFTSECPKTCENFCVHSKNGYYNGHIFHRVIKGFMIQTGDPTGTGTGGESIWGGEFADEFHPNLRHDRPYTLSMANAGPNTNGSQFFITVIPTSWLDNKHTVFGRVTKGMEVVQNISNAKVHPKTSKPYDDIKIINISLK